MIGGTVRVQNINKFFGSTQVLKDINLEIKAGEFFSLLGPSGCGKTTLLRIIAGFEMPTSGDMILDNESVLQKAPNERHVNTIFQNYALFPHLTVFENVAFSLRLKKIDKKIIKTRVEEYINLVRLNEHIGKYPAQLSGGQRQRVSIARALINEPRVLLLDEPLSALDAKLRQDLLMELDRIHDIIGITFIYVTHDQEEAMSVSDRIAVMQEGNLLQIGTPFEIYESPADMFVAEFIGASNNLEGEVLEVIGSRAIIQTPVSGAITVDMDKPLKVGDHIRVTLRPEKIHISKKPPTLESSAWNCIPSRVDQMIYTGSHTKFMVKTEQGRLFKVFKQHAQYFTTEEPIQWEDQVFIWWHADDSFIVEVKSQ
ncbi:MAG: ABC transporter ATP-binding protein [Deltaproteobacteria bacterium]|nr:ABC transporter ATP-binding protein [Deltaproteobacteria bacterium]